MFVELRERTRHTQKIEQAALACVGRTEDGESNSRAKEFTATVVVEVSLDSVENSPNTLLGYRDNVSVQDEC